MNLGELVKKWVERPHRDITERSWKRPEVSFDALTGDQARDCDVMPRRRHTSPQNTPVLDRLSREAFGVSRPLRRAQLPRGPSRA
jgi:hypothetical protein